MSRQLLSGGIAMLFLGAWLTSNQVWSQEKGSAKPPFATPLTAAEAKLYKALETPTLVEFVETPLADVILYLKDYHKAEITFDQRALDDAGVGADTPITMNLRGVTMRSALEMILRKHRLSPIVQNEVILITTEKEAERKRDTCIYDVAELLRESSAHELAEVVRQTLVPASQRDESSDVSVVPFRHLLIVRHNQAGQRQVAQFLQQLTSALKAK